jgi:hypothetical protein
MACLRAGSVQESAFVAGQSELGGPDDLCGAVHPFAVSAAANGTVALKPAALVQCAMVPAIDNWVEQVVLPAARAIYRQPVVEMKVLASYSCRPMNNVAGEKLSEHGHANAVDIGAFILASGRVISVLNGWDGSEADRSFLRRVHDGACANFTTVLGPNANGYHRDHFHLDLMRRLSGHVVCE